MYVTFFNHCCISSAAAQKQSTCKCQRMDFRVARVAQRSMIRTKQRMYISTHTPYTLQRESARAHTHTIFRERARAIFREGKRGKREREHNLRHVFHFVDERAGVVRPRERL